MMFAQGTKKPHFSAYSHFDIKKSV